MASTILNGSYRTEKCELPPFVCTMWTVLVIDELKAFIGIYDSQDLCGYCPQLCSILLGVLPLTVCHSKTLVAYFRAKFQVCRGALTSRVKQLWKMMSRRKDTVNQYASEWQQRLFECVIFYYFFSPYFFQAWNRTDSGLAKLVVASLVSIYGI